MDCSFDMSDSEEAVVNRRFTRVLKKDDGEHEDSHYEESVEVSPSSVEELLNKMDLSEEDSDTDDTIEMEKHYKEEEEETEDSDDEATIPKGKHHKDKEEIEETDEEDMIAQGKYYKEEETIPKQDEKQKRITQKPQSKKKTKASTIKAHEDITNNLETKVNKTKGEVEGKKTNSKSANINAQSEENLKQKDKKKKGLLSDNNQNDENLNKKLSTKENSDVQVKKAVKSKIETVVTENTKGKQIKPSKKVGDNNSNKEPVSNNIANIETHEEGRVMRPRKAKEPVKDINKPVNNPAISTAMDQKKRNGKKLEPETKKYEENINATTTTTSAELKVAQKKKTGKKVAQAKELEEISIPNPPPEETITVSTKRNWKKVPSETKESHEVPVLTTVKENVKRNQPQKNEKVITEVTENIEQQELNTNKKNGKAKKPPKNAKETVITDDTANEPVNIKKSKIKVRPDLMKTETLIEKENKIIESTMPNKRTTRKK